MSRPRTVIIGSSKPILNYITACITIFNEGENQILLRARGEAINMAVDVVQLLRKSFLGDVHISKISIDGEMVKSKDGRRLKLPVMEILLSKHRREQERKA